MSYIPSQNKLQYGLEAVIGDEGVDTIEPVGIDSVRITPKVEVLQIPEKRGDTMPAWQSYVTKRFSEVEFSGWVNYHRIVDTLLDPMFGITAPAPAGTWTYKALLDWAAVLEQGLSLRWGQTGALYKVGGVLPREIDFIYESGQPLKFAYRGFGNDVSDGATHADVVVDVPEWAMSHQTTIDIDMGAGATHGTTPVLLTAFKAVFTFSCGREPVWHLGALTPSSHKRGRWGGGAKLTLEGTTTQLAGLGDIIDATGTPPIYNIQMVTTGAATHVFTLNFTGVQVTAPSVTTEQDGIITVELDLKPQYNTTYASCYGASLVVA